MRDHPPVPRGSMPPSTLSALDIADRFIKWSLEDQTPITPLQVQKLVYLAQGWSLGFGEEPLFRDTIEAWQFGPVVPAVYHALKHYGRRRVRARLYDDEKYDMPETAEKMVRVVWKSFGKIDGIRLSKMTHAHDGPWADITQGNPTGQPIPEDKIREYYSRLAQAVVDEQGAGDG